MKSAARAYDLATLLDHAPEGLRYLSLDCFDTLIWRGVEAPRDVFADLPMAGGGVAPRMRSENAARRSARFNEGRSEVSIEEIYRLLLPKASEDEVTEAVARELAAEARHCFGFAPVFDLIREAKARGLGVIIVSDTYLSEPQLRRLIEDAAGKEVIDQIDRIFCSSEFGRSKGDGLFTDVLASLDVPACTILHIGDNIVADQTAPDALGVHTVHFEQFDPESAQRLRLEAAAAAVLDPATRSFTPTFQPHRPQVSLRSEFDPAWVIGHDVMGPLMHGFAHWIRDEADAMSARTGRRVKLLFMLRDGYLPKRVFDALFREMGAHAIEISRFTARCASFVDEAAVREYLAGEPEHGRVDVLARQTHLSPSEGKKLAGGRSGPAGQEAFNRAALLAPTLGKILRRSSDFADRVAAHLRREGVTEGDAVMFVDLGYNGTVQNLIEPILRARMNLAIEGRYMLLREDVPSGLDKKGFLDVRHYDRKSLHALCGYIAVIEQMCTLAQGSVVDYSADGKPIRKAADLKGGQNAARDRIQDACVAFAQQAARGVLRAPASDDTDARRRMAAAILARLLFMPLASEVEVFETFDHDVNLGTSDMVKLLDVEASATGLRRRGLSYLNDVERMYLPAELQGNGLPLNLSLFSSSRLALDLRTRDFIVGARPIPVILADNASQGVVEVDAYPTHDGYFLAKIPVGAARFSVGVQFGRFAEWIQIEDASFHPVESFGRPTERSRIHAQLIHEGMIEESPGLYRCGANGLSLVPPPQGTGDAPLLLAIVFRPLVWREAA